MRALHAELRGWLAAIVLAVTMAGAAPRPAVAQPAPPPPAVKTEAAEACPGLVAGRARPLPASYRLAALGTDQVRVTFVGHSTFLIESPARVRIATDYNDYVRPPVRPDIATMNHAHSTHYTDHPDPEIKYVLRGWAGDESQPRYDMTLRDVRVRNVPTNIRSWAGGTERYGNSIFIFETAGLCIVHLGHLHHTLTQTQLNEIGHVDAVLAPVDGAYTLDLDGMVEVLKALRAPLVIPMHYFGAATLDRFLQRLGRDFAIEMHDVPSVLISRATLPKSPKVLVLPGP